jgi:holin-like protein
MDSVNPDVLKALVDRRLDDARSAAEHRRLVCRLRRHTMSVIWTQAPSEDVRRAASPDWWPPWRPLGLDGSRLRVGLRYAAQCAVLCALFAAGTALAGAVSLPLPGNLLGMLLLLGLLSLGVVRPAHVQDGSGLLLRHLAFFFIPLNVGLIAWHGLFASSGIALAVSLTGSAVIGMVAAGLIAQWMSPRGDRDAS